MSRKQGAFAWHQDLPPQNWRTPRPLYLEIERRYGCGGFHIDLAADPTNAHAPWHFSELNSAFDGPWTVERATLTPEGAPGFDVGAMTRRPLIRSPRGFFNPPTEDIEPWCVWSAREVAACNMERVVGLVPFRTATTWWRIVQRECRIIDPILGRIRFVPPPGVEESGGAGEGWGVIIFDRPIEAVQFTEARDPRGDLLFAEQ